MGPDCGLCLHAKEQFRVSTLFWSPWIKVLESSLLRYKTQRGVIGRNGPSGGGQAKRLAAQVVTEARTQVVEFGEAMERDSESTSRKVWEASR